jgi:hypothetical protein
LGCCERLPPEPSPLFLLHANDLKATTIRYTLPLRCGLALIVHFPFDPRRSTVSARQTSRKLCVHMDPPFFSLVNVPPWLLLRADHLVE